MADIGRRIRAARKDAGLSQEALARRADISLNVVGKIETSVIKDPHYSTLLAVAEALDMSVGELLQEEPVPLGEAAEAQQERQAVELLHEVESKARTLADMDRGELMRLERERNLELATQAYIAQHSILRDDAIQVRERPELATPERREARRRADKAVADLSAVLDGIEGVAATKGKVSPLDTRRRAG